MAEGSGVETRADRLQSLPVSPVAEEARQPVRDRDPSSGGAFVRTALFIGIGVFSAGLAFAVVRATLLRPAADPTTERIQQLIDEANRLLAQLDDKKSEP
ncbi:MAG: hypothetical protein M3R44_05565 [Candidatus Eremiobacteraeota bacterium]|nr:hypothetical protein [Candidatus Eremiobacteraeota bacterium]